MSRVPIRRSTLDRGSSTTNLGHAVTNPRIRDDQPSLCSPASCPGRQPQTSSPSALPVSASSCLTSLKTDMRALASGPRTTANVIAAAGTLGITPRRIWALPRQFRMGSGDVGQFLRARHAPRSKRLRMGIEAIVQQAIDQHYAQQSRPSLTSLADEIAGRCKAAGLPARRREKAIRARVRARDQVWLVRRREGWRNARSLRAVRRASAWARATRGRSCAGFAPHCL